MDLIPLGSSSESVWEVPYLIDESQPYIYDNGSFKDFPERMGWATETLTAVNNGRPGADEEKTPQRAAALTQAWLFFGSIHLVTGIPVVTADFVTQNRQGRQIVTLRPLPKLLETWYAQATGTDSAQKQAAKDHFYSIERQLEDIGRHFTTRIGFRTDVVPSEVTLSIVLLFKILMLAKQRIFVNSTIPREHDCGDWQKVLKGNLVDMGWCKGDVERLRDRFSSVHLFCLASLGRHEPTRDHTLCDDHSCKSLTYTMRHVDGDCQCGCILSMTQVVTPMVEQEFLPLLIVDANGDLQIQAVPENDTYRRPKTVFSYVAISHLCADGLGDPDKNIAFRCQLQRLQEKVNRVMGQLLEPYDLLSDLKPVPFWLDTICVPGTGPTRALAVSRMKKIYEGASAVLVVDRDVESVTSLTSRLERALVIATSLWWTRMWTLQEGMFARSLFFQFHDQALTLNDIAGSRDEDEPPCNPGRRVQYTFGGIKSWLVGDLIRSLKFSRFENLQMTKGRSLFQWMGYRRATRMEDETVCLAILLGKSQNSVKALASSPPDSEERMKNFILMQKYFPGFLLFLGGIDTNLDHIGFRWAPKTLLGRPSLMPSGSALRHDNEITMNTNNDVHGNHINDTSWADAEGIHVEFPGLILEVANDATLEATLNEAMKDMLQALELSTSRYWQLCLARPGSDGTWPKVYAQGWNLAVVMPRTLSRGQVTKAPLVRVARREGDKIFATLEPDTRVLVVCEGELDAQDLDNRRSQRGFPVGVREVSEKQQWCIG